MTSFILGSGTREETGDLGGGEIGSGALDVGIAEAERFEGEGRCGGDGSV